MASIVAPKLDLPTTPAHEWANETSSELQSTSAVAIDSTTRPPITQTASTPGVEVPGSYPKEVDKGEPDANIPPPGRILDMAKQYLPAQEDVQGVLKNATETAKQYLPQSVAAYLPGGVARPTSLPSQEGPQKPLEHSDGVGSLPGNASEASVAKLPEERELENKDNVEDAHRRQVAEHSGGIGSLPGSAPVVAVAKLPEEKEQEKKENIGDAHKHQSPEHSSGVGSLPGSASEVAVAKLPEEKELEKEGATVDVNKQLPVPFDPPKVATTTELTPATNGAMKETVSSASIKAQVAETPLVTPGLQTPRAATGGPGGVGDLPGAKAESNVAVLPDERKEQANAAKPMRPAGEPVVNLTPRTHPLAAEGTYWKGTPLGIDSGSELDTSHVDTADNINGTPGATLAAPRTTQHTDSTVAVSGHTEPDASSNPSLGNSGSKFTESPSSKNKSTDLTNVTSTGSHESDGSRTVGGTPRKPKLMDKIKGEVKVITGKLGGKEDKVEEGRRLMGKV